MRRIGYLVACAAIGMLLIGCGVSAKDDPVMAAQAKQAAVPVLTDLAGPIGRDPIHSVTADSDGKVEVNLSFTKAFYLSADSTGRGQQALSDIAAALATPIFRAVPAAKKVTVLDSNGDLMDGFLRSDMKTP